MHFSSAQLPVTYPPAGCTKSVPPSLVRSTFARTRDGGGENPTLSHLATATHRTLTRLDDAELEREIKTAAEVVYARTRTEPTTFSYPYGIWDERVRRTVREAGYRAAVTLDYGLNTPSADLWSLRRINVPASISQSALAGWAAGVRPSRSRTSSALRGPAR